LPPSLHLQRLWDKLTAQAEPRFLALTDSDCSGTAGNLSLTLTSAPEKQASPWFSLVVWLGSSQPRHKQAPSRMA